MPGSEDCWSSDTGHIPVMKTGFDALAAKGFYDKAPYKGREVAIKSLSFTERRPLTRGLRLVGLIQIRAEWTAEVQAALSGQKSMQGALDTAAECGNAVLGTVGPWHPAH